MAHLGARASQRDLGMMGWEGLDLKGYGVVLSLVKPSIFGAKHGKTDPYPGSGCFETYCGTESFFGILL